MPPMGFELKISAGERQQTFAFDRAATGAGVPYLLLLKISMLPDSSLRHLRNKVTLGRGLAELSRLSNASAVPEILTSTVHIPHKLLQLSLLVYLHIPPPGV
jgi:hypothetical protein